MQKVATNLRSIGVFLLMAHATPALAVECVRSSFDRLPDGRDVHKYTLTNSNGIAASIIEYGASLQAFVAPDRDGRLADIALGYPNIQGYLAHRNFIGATVGRYANRIAKGRFALDGKTYQLPANDGPNSLHGGKDGLDRVLWSETTCTSGKKRASVQLAYTSADGDEGYPGALRMTAEYSLDDENRLTIEYRARTDRTTIVNITNHAYWNLSGEGSAAGAMGHLLTVMADAYTPVDSTLIPTGEIRAVDGTPFDFRKPIAVGARVREVGDAQIAIGRGYDHNFVLDGGRAQQSRLVAHIEDPASGRTLELFSDQPGLQFYSGNVLDGTEVGKAGKAYRQGDALVLEPQLFPDTPNKPAFGSAVLEPGAEYRNTMTYRVGVAGR